MRKIITNILLVSFFIISIMGCKKDSFDHQLYQPTIGEIDSVYFSPGDVMMIADGKATLKFIVEAYRKLRLQNGRDTMAFVDYRLLPAGSLKIMESVTSQQVGMTYSISSMPADTLRFYAEIGSIRSSVKKVAVRPAPATPTKLYVDVIFHVWQLNPAHPTYDPSSFQAITNDQIKEALDVVNKTVNNQLGTNPNGASANVEFRLATKNQAGQTLVIPGVNRIIYGDEIKTNPLATSIVDLDFRNYVDANPTTLIWDPQKYLNLHVLPTGSNFALGNLFPPKQLPPGPGQTLIPGIPGIASGPTDYIRNFVNVTAFVPGTLFFPGPERRIEIFSYIGNFYGLYATSAYTTTRPHSDYCFDTQEFNNNDPRNGFNAAIKVGINGEKFISDYAMDDTRYPSGRSAITLDQANRMRAVMTRAPGRMNAYP